MRFLQPSWRSMPLISKVKRRHSHRSSKLARGFTLTEMLVVMAIMALLIGLIGPAALNQLQSSRAKTAKAQIAQIQSALDIYLVDLGRHPTEAEGLMALVSPVDDNLSWNGPYLRRATSVPLDPWGQAFLYRLEDGQAVVESLGADGVVGGSGDDADLRG